VGNQARDNNYGIGNQEETEAYRHCPCPIDGIHFPKTSSPPSIVSHWDVVTLVEKKHVCRDWKQLCTDVIDAKQTETTKKAFSTIDELIDAVRKYCGYNTRTLMSTPTTIVFPRGRGRDCHYEWMAHEQLRCIQRQDFSSIFRSNTGFNKDIGGSWNVSNATTSMIAMFFMAKAFNQDISSWDVSNMRNMFWMFAGAASFNQDLSSWPLTRAMARATQ
jgi:surface protein